MAQVRNIRPGYAVIHPNRDKYLCKLTRLIVVAILLASVALMMILTIGGWSKLQGLKPINFIWSGVYLIFAFYILRWSRGLLPIAAALAILLLIVAAIAGTGLAGTSWFDRHHSGFAAPQSLLGGAGLGTNVLGSVTLLLIPVEVALIVFAMLGFAQGWNVELEVPEEEAQRRGSTPVARGPSAATA
ncbi:MAG: hypothetical protein ACR2NR_11600 [Solirubrobacteraceae bacterium]